MSIKIVEVTNKRLLKEFVTFPDRLYKDCAYYVPVLHSGEMSFYDREKNKSYEYCDSICFLAYKDNKVVGRIAGIENTKYNQKINKQQVRFTNFDFIDDYEVSSALIKAVGKWATKKGLEEFNGPIGFTDFDRQGMLIEGFEEKGMYITNYNYPYYVDHMIKMGFEKDVDWEEYIVNVPKTIDPRIERIAKMLTERRGYKLVTFTNTKDFMAKVYEAFDIYNASFEKLHGVVPLTRAQVEMYINDYIKLVNLRYCHMVEDKDGNLVAFSLLVASLFEAARKAKGKLFPFGWYPILKAFHHPTNSLDMYWIAVAPEVQGLGVHSLIMIDIFKKCWEDNITVAETGPELENNTMMTKLWEHFDTKLIRKRRCWSSKIIKSEE